MGFCSAVPIRAYPRSRGGTFNAGCGALMAGGLSPLARGNQSGSEGILPSMGPIPARAGEPKSQRLG